jgi:hypothetical protein
MRIGHFILQDNPISTDDVMQNWTEGISLITNSTIKYNHS